MLHQHMLARELARERAEKLARDAALAHRRAIEGDDAPRDAARRRLLRWPLRRRSLAAE